MADDLFGFIGALFTKKRVEGRPPIFMMHRFMASDPDYAQAAREIQRDLREPDIQFAVWSGLLPKDNGAPRFSYVAPKKAPPEEALVSRLSQVLNVSRGVAEEMVDVIRLTDRLPDLYFHYGIEPPEDK